MQSSAPEGGVGDRSSRCGVVVTLSVVHTHTQHYHTTTTTTTTGAHTNTTHHQRTTDNTAIVPPSFLPSFLRSFLPSFVVVLVRSSFGRSVVVNNVLPAPRKSNAHALSIPTHPRSHPPRIPLLDPPTPPRMLRARSTLRLASPIQSGGRTPTTRLEYAVLHDTLALPLSVGVVGVDDVVTRAR